MNPIQQARQMLAHPSSVLPYYPATRLVEYAEELRRLRQVDVETFMQQVATANDRAERLQVELDAALAGRRDDNDFARATLAENARLERVIRWQRRAFIASGVIWPLVVIALWSHYAP